MTLLHLVKSAVNRTDRRPHTREPLRMGERGPTRSDVVQHVLLPGHQLHTPEQRPLPACKGCLQGTTLSHGLQPITGNVCVCVENAKPSKILWCSGGTFFLYRWWCWQTILLRHHSKFKQLLPGGKWGSVMLLQFQSPGGFSIYLFFIQGRVMSFFID